MGLLSRLGRMIGGRSGRAGYRLPEYYTPPKPMRSDSLTAGQRNAMEARGLPMYIPPGPQRERWASKGVLSNDTRQIAEQLAAQLEDVPAAAQALRGVQSDDELEAVVSALRAQGLV